MRSACTAGLDPTDPSNMPRLWHKGEDFVKNGTNVPLLFRMATVADVKPPKGTKVSRYLWKQPSARKVRARVDVELLTIADIEMLCNFLEQSPETNIYHRCLAPQLLPSRTLEVAVLFACCMFHTHPTTETETLCSFP